MKHTVLVLERMVETRMLTRRLPRALFNHADAVATRARPTICGLIQGETHHLYFNSRRDPPSIL